MDIIRAIEVSAPIIIAVLSLYASIVSLNKQAQKDAAVANKDNTSAVDQLSGAALKIVDAERQRADLREAEAKRLRDENSSLWNDRSNLFRIRDILLDIIERLTDQLHDARHEPVVPVPEWIRKGQLEDDDK